MQITFCQMFTQVLLSIIYLFLIKIREIICQCLYNVSFYESHPQSHGRNLQKPGKQLELYQNCDGTQCTNHLPPGGLFHMKNMGICKHSQQNPKQNYKTQKHSGTVKTKFIFQCDLFLFCLQPHTQGYFPWQYQHTANLAVCSVQCDLFCFVCNPIPKDIFQGSTSILPT